MPVIDCYHLDFYNFQKTGIETDGVEVRGANGYRYYGAAKDLPGVKELFETKAVEASLQRNRAEMQRSVDSDYYGMRDDEDGVLESIEAEAEQKAVAEAVAEWRKVYRIPEEEEDKGEVSSGSDSIAASVLPIVVPTQADIEKMLLERRKAEVLKKYIS